MSTQHFLMTGPVSSLLCDKYGCRPVVMVGGLIFSIGVTASAFAQSISMVYLTFGLLGGRKKQFDSHIHFKFN